MVKMHLQGFCSVMPRARLWSEAEYLCKEVIKNMNKHPELKT